MTHPGRQVSRREWQKAIRAELAYTPSPRDRAFLLLGAVRVALLPPQGPTRALAGCGRASAFASALTAMAWIPLGAAIYLDNVVLPSATIDPLNVVVMEAYAIAVMLAAGVAARRACARPAALAVAGFAAGIVMTVLNVALIGVMEAVMLKATSGAAPITAPVVSVFFQPVFGAALAPLGAALSRARFVTRDRSRLDI